MAESRYQPNSTAEYDDSRNELEGLLSVRDDNGELRAFELTATRSSAAWDHSIEVELLSETTNIVPGETTWLALRLDPAEHWHTYWKMGVTAVSLLPSRNGRLRKAPRLASLSGRPRTGCRFMRRTW